MKYIDAEKMIAEIERQQRRLMVLSNTKQANMLRDCAVQNGVYNSILVLINSLQHEQSNADLEKEIANQYESNYEEYLLYEEFADIAKHFYELGLKAQKV